VETTLNAVTERATAGEEIHVDYSAIEATLAEIWRNENNDAENALTRAALWNVIAHTPSAKLHAFANETLSKAAATVPQRTIVIRSEPDTASEMTSWVSANCHLVGGKKQVCSEEIAIVAGGDRIHHIAPLVSALLLPDMPVAFWWVGDLPNELEEYVETLLDPADRLIVDSAYFDRIEDFALIERITKKTTTMPADLNWVRLEEWRLASAGLFDPETMRERLQHIRRVEISAVAGENPFGGSAEALLYAAWLTAQLGQDVDYRITTHSGEGRAGSLTEIGIVFDDGSSAALRRDEERAVIVTSVDGTTVSCDHVTRMLSRSIDDLIVRQLQRTNLDEVFLKVLPIVTRLARRLSE
jgi:glucose-6-phosphate dehydrogenase assembly protein OpcA